MVDWAETGRLCTMLLIGVALGCMATIAAVSMLLDASGQDVKRASSGEAATDPKQPEN